MECSVEHRKFNGSLMVTNNSVNEPTAASGKVLQGQGVGTGTILRADGTNWSATTSTYPNTNAANTLLYASSANTMAALTTANSGVLTTNSSGVPSIDTTNFAVLSTGVQMKGNNTNTAPPAGFIGEQISNSGSISLSNGTAANICSISLTAGIWDVSGMGDFNSGGAVTGTSFRLGINNTSATMPGSGGINQLSTPTAPNASSNSGLCITPQRRTLSGTTTVYLIALANFTVGTVGVQGYITATRVG